MLRGRGKDYLKGTRRYSGGRHFSIERFLRSRLGCKWADVHSELSEEFDRRTYAGHQFWNNLRWNVAERCWIGAETGTIYTTGRWGEERVDGFYVHPMTGLLKYQAPLIKKKKDPAELKRVVINDRRFLEKIEGIWYRCDYNRSYDGILMLDKKHQLNRWELQSNNLTNDDPMEWEQRICEVCELIDNCQRLQRCKYCKICGAWLCENDQKTDWQTLVRRTQAMERRALIRLGLRQQKDIGV